MIARAVQDVVPHEVCARLCAGAAIAANEASEREMLKIGMSMLLFVFFFSFFGVPGKQTGCQKCLDFNYSRLLCLCIRCFVLQFFCLSSVITHQNTNCQNPAPRAAGSALAKCSEDECMAASREQWALWELPPRSYQKELPGHAVLSPYGLHPLLHWTKQPETHEFLVCVSVKWWWLLAREIEVFNYNGTA